MFLSMTGFGLVQENFKVSRGVIEVRMEIRTVNSKFLDLSLRSPKSYMIFDPKISEIVRQKFKRGRVDFSLQVRTLEGKEREITVNLVQAQAVLKAFQSVQKKLKLKSKIDLSTLLQMPEWLQTKDLEIDTKDEWPLFEKLVHSVIDKVLESRRSEGKTLHRIVSEQRQKFENEFRNISKLNDEILQALRVRGKQRLNELFQSQAVDPARLEQEIVLWMSRADVKEEIDRIDHHLQSFDELLKTTNEVGRKVEFLLQELHRETNTLGTKLPDAKLMPRVIEMKTCLERMKEQIQNVE